jgi:outer membrane murein-binding lipoprotein Lpp
MRKTVLLLAVMAAALLMAGCSEPNVQQDKPQRESASKEQRAAPEQEKTVVVNEGMSKKEVEKLNERLAELEDKVEQENAQPEATEPEAESAEDQALEAAQDYYAAAAAGNYTYTYDALTSYDQGRFTEEEWVAANTALGSDDASYDIYSTELVDDTTATVALTITTLDGSIDDRTTLFVYENGDWKHELTQREYDLFAGAPASATATATATATASANGSPNPSPNRNAPNPNVPSPGGGGGCEPPAYPVSPGDERDGDNDGCAGEE